MALLLRHLLELDPATAEPAMTKNYNPKTFSPSHFRRSLSGADLTALEYRILVEMCEHSQIDKPVVRIGSPRLAGLCGCTPESVRKCWGQLKAKGFIYPVGKHGGGNKVDRWRLIDNGMRTNRDGQPWWDPNGWEAGVYCESAERCEACGEPDRQPYPASRQPYPETPPTVSRDAANRIPTDTRSSKEADAVCFADCEAAAPVGARLTPLTGGSPAPRALNRVKLKFPSMTSSSSISSASLSPGMNG
jgi:hypothetical protein